MKDSAALKKEAEEVRAAILKEDGALEIDEIALETKREKLSVLEIQSEINLPEVRWKVANGMGTSMALRFIRCVSHVLRSRYD